MEIERKSLGLLIDELITTSNKLWHLQDKIEENSDITDAEVSDAFRKIQTLNVRRNKLINAIDRISGSNAFSTMEKTYK
jgi:hypothetical protein